MKDPKKAEEFMKALRSMIALLLVFAMTVLTACGNGEVVDTDQVTGEAANTESDTEAQTDAETDAGKDPEPTVDKKTAVFGEAGEIAKYDPENANYTIGINAAVRVHDISDLLFGIFLEDINFAADGGLYAEMVKNRSFEFTEYADGDEKHGWLNVGDVKANVVTKNPDGSLNDNNPNYMVIENTSNAPAGIENVGFLDGISVEKGKNYKFSVYVRGIDGYTGPVYVSIARGNTLLAEGKIDSVTSEWTKYELTLTSNATNYSGVRLRVTIDAGKAAFDMISLFPEDTYKGRENGLRADLAEKLEALEPAFLRFPGGCIIEGMTLDTAYNWKDSVGADENGDPYSWNGTYGDVAARTLGFNLWTNEGLTDDQHPVYMTYGLGFYEYFLLAEDIGAIGVPVLNAGVACMGQSSGELAPLGSDEMERFIKDALDLVEFCRGGADTEWGAVRIAMGHEEPFELKYIGIGNEQWGNDFFKHYEAFVDAFAEAKAADPELFEGVELMFSAGVDDGDSGWHYMAAYEYAEKWMKANPDKNIEDFAGAIDHHYYNEPEWFFENADYYDEDNYSRDSFTDTIFGGGIQVFLGEYAARSNTLKAALAEAAYMTGLERNGDIVRMAAYAPLFGNLTGLHWAPDLIWFNNHTVTSSINYYVQKIFLTNAGTELIESELVGAEREEDGFVGKVGVGTWSTSAKFDNVKIVDNETGKVLAEDTFDDKSSLDEWTKVSDGAWSVKKGALMQTSTTTNTDKYGTTGTVMYFGNRNWTNYTFTVDVTKTGGSEGFLIPFSVGDKDNNYFWNIGGWNNTVTCLQQVKDGAKTDPLVGTERSFSVINGRTYTLKIVVTDFNVKCYINDKLYIDYTIRDSADADAYHVVSTDETGDIIIKLVNVTGKVKTFAIDIVGLTDVSSTAEVDLVAGTSLKNDNILGAEEDVSMTSFELDGVSEQFNYTVPKYSVTVIRIKSEQ